MNMLGVLQSHYYSYHADEMWRGNPSHTPREPYSRRRKAKVPALGSLAVVRRKEAGESREQPAAKRDSA